MPVHQPYCVALDGTIVPHTGNSIPGAHWTPNPANAPFARGLRKAQRLTRAGWRDKDPNARYANPASRRSEIASWIASLQRVRAWLNAAGRTEQRLLCVGGGRGDTQALGTLDVPNTVCLVRTRKDSRGGALPP